MDKTENELIAEFRGIVLDWDVNNAYSSWDSIIPVVQQIENMGHKLPMVNTSSFEVIKKAVVEFIKWYNSRKS